jgi:hypothetical protein
LEGGAAHVEIDRGESTIPRRELAQLGVVPDERAGVKLAKLALGCRGRRAIRTARRRASPAATSTVPSAVRVLRSAIRQSWGLKRRWPRIREVRLEP